MAEKIKLEVGDVVSPKGYYPMTWLFIIHEINGEFAYVWKIPQRSYGQWQLKNLLLVLRMEHAHGLGRIQAAEVALKLQGHDITPSREWKS